MYIQQLLMLQSYSTALQFATDNQVTQTQTPQKKSLNRWIITTVRAVHKICLFLKYISFFTCSFEQGSLKHLLYVFQSGPCIVLYYYCLGYDTHDHCQLVSAMPPYILHSQAGDYVIPNIQLELAINSMVIIYHIIQPFPTNAYNFISHYTRNTLNSTV